MNDRANYYQIHFLQGTRPSKGFMSGSEDLSETLDLAIEMCHANNATGYQIYNKLKLVAEGHATKD